MKTGKICFFNTCKAWGGGEKWHFELAEKLNEKGRDILIISNKDSELYKKSKIESLNVKEFKVSNLSFLNGIKIFKLYKFLKKENLETIIMNLPADLKFAGLASKFAGIKNIIYRRGSAIPIKNTFLNRFYFKNIITGIIANSLKTKETILEKNKNLIQSDKIKVIYNGLDFSKYVAKEFSFKKEEGELILGNLGRLVEQKGQKFLIEIGKVLKEKEMKFKILIAGSGSLEEELKQSIKENNLENEIKMIGFLEDVAGFMQSIDIFLLPSLWEGFGYVMAEAMYFNKTVIAFNKSSNPEIIEDKETGYLVEDIKGFVDKIEELNNNKELRKNMGINGHKRVLEKFSIENTIKNLEDVI